MAVVVSVVVLVAVATSLFLWQLHRLYSAAWYILPLQVTCYGPGDIAKRVAYNFFSVGAKEASENGGRLEREEELGGLSSKDWR